MYIHLGSSSSELSGNQSSIQVCGSMSMHLNVVVPLVSVIGVNSHGAVVMPPARNSVDSEITPWNDGEKHYTGSVEPWTCGCTNGTDACLIGQACFWFSNGCAIGCDKCDGSTRGPIPAFAYAYRLDLQNLLRLLPRFRRLKRLRRGLLQSLQKFTIMLPLPLQDRRSSCS